MRYCQRYNKVSEPVDGLTDQTEPVSLAYFKNYARIGGFTEQGAGDPLTFTSDDELIADLITGAREALERWTGLALVNHNWSVQVTNLLGDVELPFSNGTITWGPLLDSDGAAITEFETTEGPVATISSPQYADMELTYLVQPVCPARLKMAICVEALYRYENRGDVQEQGSLSEKARAMAAPFKKVSTWLA